MCGVSLSSRVLSAHRHILSNGNGAASELHHCIPFIRSDKSPAQNFNWKCMCCLTEDQMAGRTAVCRYNDISDAIAQKTKWNKVERDVKAPV